MIFFTNKDNNVTVGLVDSNMMVFNAFPGSDIDRMVDLMVNTIITKSLMEYGMAPEELE
ncbi:MAG: hypothetical protein KAQ85_01390 [Thermodesulfovibrionia bacterium]|nr:hypothetical protein [Thermodesulfovibrionia bacterium]